MTRYASSQIYRVIFLLIRSFLEAAQPIIDSDFTFPVLIGMPKMEEMAIVKKELKSEQNELWKSSALDVLDSVFIILPPPSIVESDIISATSIIKDIGGTEKTLPPRDKTKSKMPSSFCPSCEPWA